MVKPVLIHSLMHWSITKTGNNTGNTTERNNPFKGCRDYCWFFASMDIVACGTKRKRSFGINLPVTRHTP